MPEVHKQQLGASFQNSLGALQSPDVKTEDFVLGTEWDFKAMQASFRKALLEPLDSDQLMNRKIHVGLMDYMGESHESYRRDLDFLETTNTWFDTDSPTRRKVHYLPDECGWQDPSVYEDLAARVEDGFSLVLKVSHVATHMSKLERPHEWWPKLWDQKYSRVANGTVAFLWQFAPSFRFQPQHVQRLDDLFKYLSSKEDWDALRHIVDFRHSSWYNEEVYELLRKHRVCLAWLHLQNTGWASDLPSGWTAQVQTTDFTFLRLFGNEDRCTGWYDQRFLQDLYAMCPAEQHSYVLFGNKTTKADPEPLVSPCSLNARDFRAIFSTVDLVAHIVGIQNCGRSGRRLSSDESMAVTGFFIRYSEKARRAGLQMQMPVWIVDAVASSSSSLQPRCFEWRCPSRGAIRGSICEASEQQDILALVRQLTGMEDVDVVEAFCEAGARQLDTAEAKLVNATFLRYCHRARDAGVLQTTAVEVAQHEGEFVFQWLSSKEAVDGQVRTPFVRLSCSDLRMDVADDTDIWATFCDLKSGTVPAVHSSEDDKVALAEVKKEPKDDSCQDDHVKPDKSTPVLMPVKKEEKDLQTGAFPVKQEEVKDESLSGSVDGNLADDGMSSSWDPATGKWVKEELPDDILNMMSALKPAALQTTPKLDFASVVTSARKVMGEVSTFSFKTQELQDVFFSQLQDV